MHWDVYRSHKSLLIIFLFIISHIYFPGIFSVFAQTPQTLYAGTGQAVSSNPVISTMAQEAVSKAKNSYTASAGSGSVPSAVIVMENVGDQNGSITSAIHSSFGNVPIVGVQIPWSDYTPYTLENIPASADNKSVSIMAIGGTSFSLNYALGVGDFGSNSYTEAQKGGHDLATKLKPDSSQHNLILLFGPMHTPLNEYVVKGMKEIYGDPLPQYIKIVGWGSSYWGGVVNNNGTLVNNEIEGVMLTGSFRWSFTGINHGVYGWDGTGPDNGDPVAAIANQYQKIITDLGQQPTINFMVIAHPDRSLFPAIRDATALKIPGKPMIGMHAGSETGHDTTTGDVFPDASHFFLAGLAAPANSTGASPTIVPTTLPTLLPTSVLKAGDANGDGRINGADFVIWLNHYNQMVTGGASVGDFNNNGKVDGADFVTWLNNYGK